MPPSARRYGAGVDVDTSKELFNRSVHYNELRERLGASMQNIVQIASSIPGSTTYEGDKHADLGRLRDAVAELAKMDAESMQRKNACEDLRLTLVRVLKGEAQPVNEYEAYKAQVDANKEHWMGSDSRAVLESSNVQNMDDLIQGLDGGDDEVVVEGATDAPTKCLFTGGELVEPVRNKPCGHVYSTQGAIAYLCGGSSRMPRSLDKVNSAISRPCCKAGCQKLVSAATLERDFATEASQRRAARRAATQRDDDDVVDI